MAMPGGKPLKPRVFAGRPDESGRGTHECVRHELPSRPCAGDSFPASEGAARAASGTTAYRHWLARADPGLLRWKTSA